MTSSLTQQLSPSVRFDHAGFIVENLDASSSLMGRLGFTQTLRADHTRTDAQGAKVSAGSSQRCIMLQRGYIELMQITDPTQGHQLALASTERYGLHLLGLGTEDAIACRAARVRSGVDVSDVLYWSRPIKEADLDGVAQFAYFGSAWQPQDPSYVFWVEHRTPELLRSPALVRHANGAIGLTGFVYRGPEHQARAWVAQLRAAGFGLDREDACSVTLALPDARVLVQFDPGAERVRPVAMELDFEGCTELQRRCVELGVAHTRLPGGGLQLDLVEQLGMHWICRQTAMTQQPQVRYV